MKPRQLFVPPLSFTPSLSHRSASGQSWPEKARRLCMNGLRMRFEPPMMTSFSDTSVRS